MIEKITEKQQGKIDLVSINTYHPEVLQYYSLFCEKMGFLTYSGGTFEKQGSPIIRGHIMSGYRQGDNGAHGTAGAIDIHVGKDLPFQLQCIKAGLECGFTRGGVYTSKSIIHLDIMDEDWIRKHAALPFWMQKPNKHGRDFYIGVKTIEELEKLVNGFIVK